MATQRTWRTTYTPGSWLVLNGPQAMVTARPSSSAVAEQLARVWSDVVAATDLETLVTHLMHWGMDVVPDLIVIVDADGLSCVVRGALDVRDAETGAIVADGRGQTAWRTAKLDTRHVLIDLPGETKNGVRLPLAVGVVAAGSLEVDARDGVRVDIGDRTLFVSPPGTPDFIPMPTPPIEMPAAPVAVPAPFAVPAMPLAPPAGVVVPGLVAPAPIPVVGPVPTPVAAPPDVPPTRTPSVGWPASATTDTWRFDKEPAMPVPTPQPVVEPAPAAETLPRPLLTVPETPQLFIVPEPELAAEPDLVLEPEVSVGVDEDGRFVRQFVQTGPVIITQQQAAAAMPSDQLDDAAGQDDAEGGPGDKSDPKHFDWWHPEPGAQGRPAPDTAPMPVAAPMPEPAPQMMAQPQPTPQAQPVQQQPQMMAQPQPVPQPQPQVMAQPAPQPVQQPQPAPEPEPEYSDDSEVEFEGSPTGATELVLADGQRWPVDDPLLVGRAPQAYPGEDAQLVRVASPHHDISRTHVRIELYDGAIWATDRDSTNGTVVHNPGQEPVTAVPNQPVHVWVGGIIDIGDGVTIRVQ